MSQALKFRTIFAAITLGSLLASNSFALVLDKPPTYTISPSLSGLNIAYFAKQDKVKITLYLVNHERFPVLCDAEYTGGPDKVDTSEQTVLPEKAIAFTFSYPQVTDNVAVQLVCIKPKEQNNADTEASTAATAADTAAPDSKTADTAAPAAVQVPETDLSVKY